VTLDGLLANPEALKLAGVVFTATAPGVGFLVKVWADRKIATANKAAAAASDTATALAEAQRQLIISAERRETEANDRAEAANQREAAAVTGMGQLAQIVTELTNVTKITQEEMRRANTNLEFALRERR
jgi:hypothetical protein